MTLATSSSPVAPSNALIQDAELNTAITPSNFAASDFSHTRDSRISKQVSNRLDQSAEFNKKHFGIQSPEIVRVIDEGYREQLVMDAEAAAVRNIHGIKGEVHAQEVDRIIAKEVENALSKRADFADFWERCSKKPSIGMMGTANNKLVDPELRDTRGNKAAGLLYYFIETLGDYASRAGISANNGGSSTGIMGAQSNAWHRGVVKNGGSFADEEGPQTMVVPLTFHEKEGAKATESTTSTANPHFIGPTMHTFLGRTPALLVLGRNFTMDSTARKVIVVCPGGAGTIEEYSRLITDIKQSDRTTYGLFKGERAKPPLILVVGSNIDGKPFWAGLEKFMGMMHKTGASDFSNDNVRFVNIESVADAEALALNIVNNYDEKDSVQKPEPAQLPGLSDIETSLVQAVDNFLNFDDDFRERRFSCSDSRYLRILDAQYAEEVRIQAGRYALRKYGEYLSRGMTEGEAELRALDKAIDAATEWRDDLRSIVDVCKDKKTITIIGSGKSAVWSHELQKITDDLMQEVVKKGYNVIVTGDASAGTAKRVSESWLLSKALYESEGEKSDSTLIRFQLETNGQRTALEFEGCRETLGPALQSSISKSGLVTALGRENYVLVYPHGHAEMDMVEGAVLAAQLKEVVDTPYRGKECAPGIAFLNASIGGHEPFFEGKKELYETMGKTLAANSDFLSSFPFMGTGDSKGIVETVCQHLESGKKLEINPLAHR